MNSFKHKINEMKIVSKNDLLNIKDKREEFLFNIFKEQNIIICLAIYKELCTEIKNTFINEITGKNKMEVATIFYDLEQFFINEIFTDEKVKDTNYDKLRIKIINLIKIFEIDFEKEIGIIEFVKYLIMIDLLYILNNSTDLIISESD